jgi:hypothetical protein
MPLVFRRLIALISRFSFCLLLFITPFFGFSAFSMIAIGFIYAAAFEDYFSVAIIDAHAAISIFHSPFQRFRRHFRQAFMPQAYGAR